MQLADKGEKKGCSTSCKTAFFSINLLNTNNENVYFLQ
jgi:hypothetical protein